MRSLSRLFHHLSDRVRILVENSRSLTLLVRYVNLLDPLDLRILLVVIIWLMLSTYLFSKSKEISLTLTLLLLTLLILLGNLLLLIKPGNVNTLLDNIIPSGLTILINQSLNIPGQFFILTISSHVGYVFLLFSLVEISIRLVNILQIWPSVER